MVMLCAIAGQFRKECLEVVFRHGKEQQRKLVSYGVCSDDLNDMWVPDSADVGDFFYSLFFGEVPPAADGFASQEYPLTSDALHDCWSSAAKKLLDAQKTLYLVPLMFLKLDMLTPARPVVLYDGIQRP